MKKVLLTVVVLLLGLQLAAVAEPLRIGVVNSGKVFENSEPGSAALEQLQNKFQSMTQDLQRMRDEVTALREELQSQGLALSMEARQDKELEFRRKMRDFQDTSQAYQQKFKVEEAQLSEPILALLQEVIVQFGKDNGYDLLLDTNARVSGLLYNSEAVDVTDQVTQALNQAWRQR